MPSPWIDLLKWVSAVLGAVASFWVIDIGKLRLEQFKARTENRRALLQAYLTATESVQPDVWKRKLRVLQKLAEDEPIRKWADGELKYIEEFAALDALYREALATSSQLVYKGTFTTPARESFRARFEQLYWADLPFAGESEAVSRAMIQFRKALERAEANPDTPNGWNDLDIALIELASVLQEEIAKLKA